MRSGAPEAAWPAWRRRFPHACDWDAPLEIATLPDLLAAGCVAAGQGPAIEFRGRRLSYPDFAAQVERLAAGFLAMGLAEDAVIGLYLPNTPLHPIAFFAAARAGLRVVLLSGLDAPRELAHKLAVTHARIILTTNLPSYLKAALHLLEQGLVDGLVVAEDRDWGPCAETEPQSVPQRAGIVPLARLLDAPPPAAWPVRRPDDVFLLQFTGGTTGLPKAAMLTQGNLTAAVAIYRLWNEHPDMPSRDNRVVGMLPLFHIYALTAVLLCTIRDGGLILLHHRFDVEALADDIALKRATCVYGVPTMWFALLERATRTPIDCTSLRLCMSGGAPLPFDVQARLGRILGQPLQVGWGMTETAPAGTRVPDEAEPRPGLIGVPLPGIAMRVVALDDFSREVATGEVGEIAIRGPNVFRGYFENPEATRDAFRDGWFLTGDIGRVDEDGLFDLIDRRKNMILSSGFNVYPTVIESAIYEHPDVAEVIVIGIPDAYRGQSAKAFVTLRPGAAPFDLTELQGFLADRIGRHEIPRALEFRDSLPRSPAGKLLASVLVAEERDRAAHAGSKGA
ncbi:AMP-binding protein [Methylobacterium sp. J-030]|uniref:AMP-binding protein n=1 Tax=Methylobacterium sp. J-030 TaxID=2836627 RepID=UPI001FBBA9DA|nr:AMP-binding protein [Methylobacterium sp. J-030]MCJ2070463.1 AMP-binding protein [Methylobacterium sp. J-030]